MKARVRCGMLVVAVAVAVALAVQVPAMAAGTAAMRVEIRNFTFAPATVTVRAGTRVVWTNKDEEPHTVTSAGSRFTSSAALDSDDSYAFTFSKPGTYAYYCSIHPMMVGTIVVK